MIEDNLISAKMVGLIMGISEDDAHRKITWFLSPDKRLTDAELELEPKVVNMNEFGNHVGIDFNKAIANIRNSYKKPGVALGRLMSLPGDRAALKISKPEYWQGMEITCSIPSKIRVFLPSELVQDLIDKWMERYKRNSPIATKTGIKITI